MAAQLKNAFQPYDYEFSLWDEIRHRTQGAKERIVNYVSVMENLFRKLPQLPSERTRLQIILRNILPHIQSRLATYEIFLLSQLVQLSGAIEETATRIQNFIPPPTNHRQVLEPGLAYHKPQTSLYLHSLNSSEEIPSSDGTPECNIDAVGSKVPLYFCWNCKERHRFRECPKPLGRFCFRCGTKDVTLKGCPSCSKNAAAGRQ